MYVQLETMMGKIKENYLAGTTASVMKSIGTRHKGNGGNGAFVKCVDWVPKKEAIQCSVSQS